jgi:hypothetical protein
VYAMVADHVPRPLLSPLRRVNQRLMNTRIAQGATLGSQAILTVAFEGFAK